MKKEILFPFIHDTMLDYCNAYIENRPGFSWKPNEVFKDTIKYQGYSRGRSSALLKFTRKSNGETLSFFMTDADDLIPLLIHGEYTGWFTRTKRGTNYATKATLMEIGE